MKLLVLIVSIILIATGIYLNRVYSNFFDRIGEHNLRDPYLELTNGEVVPPQGSPEGTVYLVLGDSISRGVGASTYKNTFPYLIMEREPSPRIVNKAQPGARLVHVFSQIEMAESLKPNIITVLIGINDVFNRTPIDEFESEYDRMLTELDQKRAKTIVITIPYLASPDSALFPYNILLDAAIKRYNTKIKSVVKKHPDIKMLDLYEQSADSFKKTRDLYSKDLFHPSDKGYILISDILTNANFSK